MFKNLKSLFIVTEEEQIANNPEMEKGNHSANPTATASFSAPTPSSSGVVDNKILDKLLKAIEDNNQQGFDYLEYRQSLKALAALPMDEATKFQSAFATASTMGITLEKLLDSIEFYKKVLQNEEDKFKKATKEQSSVNVDGKLKERDSLNQMMVQKGTQIQKLTEEIRQHQIEVEELNKFIQSSETKISETSMNFETSLKVIVGQLEQDALKLKQYIK